MNDRKKRYKILTDSGCDIPREAEEAFGIDIMAFSIMIDDQEYRERIDLTPQEFYDLANNSSGIPKTSQITPMRFEEKFRQYAEEGYEDVFVVLINSTGSQTYANAVLAEETLREEGVLGRTRFHILDSHCYSVGYGYAVIEAAKKLNAGKNAEQVKSFLVDWFNCVEIYIVGFDLRHMKKSGRISAAAAFLGELMGLKPVISLIDGKSTVVKKSRGEKAAIEDAVKHIAGRAVPETPWMLLRTTVTENENAFIKAYGKKVGQPPSMESYSGGAVTSNAGTKFIGIVVRGEPRR